MKITSTRELAEWIPAEAVRTLLQSIERCGYDATPMLSALSMELRELAAPAASAPWEDMIRLVETFHRAHGRAELSRVARDAATSLSRMRQLGALLLPPRAFYWLLMDLAARLPMWTLRTEELGSTFAFALEIRRGLRSAPCFLEALADFLAATPRLLNLEDARVEVRGLHSHGARYVLWLPRGRTLQVRVSEAQLVATSNELRGLGAPVRASVPSLAQLERHFGLTRAEGRVVRRLVAGHSLNEIAKELSVGAETVRTHAKRSMQKTDTHRQAELVALVLRHSALPDSEGE